MMMLRRAALAASTLLLLGCEGPASRPPPDPADLPLQGTKPVAPMGKVDFTMPDTRGQPYDFRAETEGRIALLYFGYTYCPDVCPVQMATLGAATKELDPEIRDRMEVVFVTVDPDRDTPDRLRTWLGAFDTSFRGVRGTMDQIVDALDFYRYPPPERSAEGDSYTVGHPAIVYLYTPDGKGRAMYDAQTSKNTWLHDLRMVAGYPWAAWDSTAAGAPPPADSDAAGEAAHAGPAHAPGAPLTRAGDIQILDAYAPAPADGERTSVYLTLANAGSGADTLVSLSSPVAGSASLHDMRTDQDGMMHMVPMEHGLVIPPGATVQLAPGERHGMLEEVEPGAMIPGRTVDVTLIFARAGSVTLTIRVVRYGDMGG